jgi:hypothetical protein
MFPPEIAKPDALSSGMMPDSSHGYNYRSIDINPRRPPKLDCITHPPLSKAFFISQQASTFVEIPGEAYNCVWFFALQLTARTPAMR